MKKILVTGGAGFVGTHLVSNLSQTYQNVVVFDNFSTGRLDIDSLPNNVTVITGDIRNIDELKTACEGVDAIVHLAAIVSVSICEEHPELCREVNVLGTQNVLRVAHELGIKKVVYASSSAVYGNLSSSCTSEQDPTIPISQYGISKLENEHSAYEYANSVSSTGLRFFNIYGPGLSMENAYPSVLVSFFKSIRNGKPITVFGDGTQTRDFVHVHDIVASIILALAKDIAGAEIFNVGTGVETCILDIAYALKSFSDQIEIEHLPSRDFDIAQSKADISKIRERVGFTPNRNVLNDLPNLMNEYLS